jgi:hypothetical protein
VQQIKSRVTQWILISPFQAAERREIFLAAKHSPHLEAKSNPLLVNGTLDTAFVGILVF